MNNIKGTIKIFLPMDLDFTSNIYRKVKKNGIDYDQRASLNEHKDDEGDDNNIHKDANDSKYDTPFDIGIKSIVDANLDGYVAIHVIKRGGALYKLYSVDNDDFTVLGDNIGLGTFCGPDLLENRVTHRQVAVFHVDIKVFSSNRTNRSFSIGVMSHKMRGTPIFIDPKVRDMG